MAFGSGKMEFNCIYSYAQALEVWENITPWRGEERSKSRPLSYSGGPRKRHHSIIKYDGSIACELYNTDVVTFYEDGRMVLKTGGWDTNTTRDFICAAQQYSVFAHRGRTYVRVNGLDYLVTDNGTEIKDGVVLNPTQEETTRIEKAKAKIVRKNIAGIEQYMHTMNAISKGQLDRQELFRIAEEATDDYNLREIIKNLDDPDTVIPHEAYPVLFAKLMREYSRGGAGIGTVITRFRELAYAMSGAIEEVPVQIGFLPPPKKWEKYQYSSFL